MANWIQFRPDLDAKVLYIDILVDKLLEIQPGTIEEADELCRDLYPVLDKVYEMCLAKGFKQVCSADLQGVQVHTINPIVMTRIIWNIHEHTKNCKLLQTCQVSGGDPVFNALAGGVRGLLPPFLQNMLP